MSESAMYESQRERLAARPLADLHALASELGIDRFRLLRKLELAGEILDRRLIQEGVDVRPTGRAANAHRIPPAAKLD